MTKTTWNLDKCRAEALRYKTRNEWCNNSNYSYNVARINKWLDECCSHMEQITRKPEGYWTLERCKEDALNYTTKSEWQNNSSGYKAAVRNNWLKQCCEHMINGTVYWTLEKCKEDALKYKTKSEWQNNSSGYSACLRNNWIDECCNHMGLDFKTNGQKSNGHWTLERCKEEALKYKTRSEWSENSRGAYKSAQTNKWMEECCGHMISIYWTLERCKQDAIKYKTKSEWSKNSCAYNACLRNDWLEQCCEHMVDGAIYWTLERCIEDALNYKTKSEWRNNSGGYDVCVRNNWLSLCCGHMVSGHKINGQKFNGYWTLERCKEEAIKYKTKSEWYSNSSSSYASCCSHNWLDLCCGHMEQLIKPKGYWTLEKCKEDAINYQTRSKWAEKSNFAYTTARENNWMEECCSHMIQFNKPRSYWTLERCKEDALNYKTKSEWRNNSSVYDAARENNWIGECCEHMIPLGNMYKRMVYVYEFPNNHAYTGLTHDKDERQTGHSHQGTVCEYIQETGLQPVFVAISDYIDVKEAQKLEEATKVEYEQNGWIMLNEAKTGGLGGSVRKWTLEACQEDALKYNTRGEWRLNSANAYSTCCRRKWLDLCCSHMSQIRKPSGYWTLERCKEDALKYKTIKEWREYSSGYASCKRNKWTDLCCEHMKTMC